MFPLHIAKETELFTHEYIKNEAMTGYEDKSPYSPLLTFKLKEIQQ